MKKIAVLTSGGGASGMNSAIRAVVRRGIYQGLDVFGVENGFEGLLKETLRPMDLGSVGGIIHRGGSILGSGRSEYYKTEEGQEKAVRFLRRAGVDGLVVIGGDGSLIGAQRLSGLGFPVIGIPVSVDNSIWGTEYAIGFQTAVNTVIEAVDRIRETASSHDRTHVIEIGGRHSDELALYAGLCSGAETILVREARESLEEVIDRVKQGFRRGKTHSIIIVAEGVYSAREIGRTIEENTGYETKVTILSTLHRGGAPVAYDRMLSSQMGAEAVDLLLEGKQGIMVGIAGPRLTYTPLHLALSKRNSSDFSIHQLARSLSI